MGKLHELLAVESDLKARAQAAIAAVKGTFSGNAGALLGQTRVYRPLSDGGEPLPDENKVLAMTANGQIDLFWGAFSAWVDAAIQKEVTNQSTSADIEINGTVIMGGLPAPALLNLESRLAELRSVIDAIPVLDMADEWTWDTKNSRYVSRERITYRTAKLPKAFVAYEATKEHPAQVQMFTEDVRVGEWKMVIHSGAMTLARKTELLNRVDQLAHAVKKARQRANDFEVRNVNFSEPIHDFVFRE